MVRRWRGERGEGAHAGWVGQERVIGAGVGDGVWAVAAGLALALGVAAGEGAAVGSALLAALAWSLVRSRGKVERRALKITEELRRSERKATEARLDAERALADLSAYRTALDCCAIVSVTDAAGRIVHANDLFCRISGYSREELIGANHRLVNSGAHPKSMWAEMWRALAAGRVWRGEICNRRKDGTLFWVDTTIAPMVDSNGRIERYIAIRADVTERKQAEQRLVEREGFLQTALDLLPQRVFWKDFEGRYLGANRAFRGDAGVEDVKGMTDHDMPWRGAEAEKFRAVDRRVMASGAAEVDMIDSVVQGDGSQQWLVTNKTPLRDASGRVTGVLGTYFDITSIKRTEQALAIERERVLLVLDGAGLGSWDWNARTNAVVFGGHWASMLGERLEDLAATLETWSSRVHPEDLGSAMEAIARHMRGETPIYQTEFRMRHRDGSWRWILDCGKVVSRTEQGEPLRMVGIHYDVTERKAAEAALKAASEAAEAASRAKSSFLANMSHEIRTPLTAILGYAEVLEEEETRPEAKIQAVATIRDAGNHLLAIINDILDLSKIEAGMMTIEPIATSLGAILGDVERMMLARTEAKGLRLSVACGDRAPDQVVIDPTRLRQILVNLVGNAVKFTEKGRVSLRVAGEPNADGQSGDRLVFSVTDTGPGMSPEQIERLFRPFSQADPTVTRRFGGTGLGLTISRRLAQMMHGEVRVARSAPGEGSCFELVVPLTPATGAKVMTDFDRAPSTHAPGAGPKGNTPPLRGRILLAEDGADNQRLIAHHLRRAGAEVDVAENGRVALEMFEREAMRGAGYDLVLTDMQMPEMDGYTLSWTLRERGYRIAIVALTANAMSDEAQRCLEAGCDEYASKPIDREALVRVCREWMGRGGKGMRAAA